MFVRFRKRNNRLLVGLIEAKRVNGKSHNEYVASLGSVPLEPSVDDRIAFWQRFLQRIGNLGNRVDAATQEKIFASIHARIPMAGIDDQRSVQLRNAEAGVKFWSSMRDMNQSRIDDYKRLIASAEKAIANLQPAVAAADAKVKDAGDRVERIKEWRGRGRRVRQAAGRRRLDSDHD